MSEPRFLLGLPLPGPDRPTISCGRLYGAARSLAIAEILERREGSVCVVAESAAAADRLEREHAFFECRRKLHRFPDYETLPYDAFSPPQELLAERLSALHRLARGERVALLLEPSAMLSRLPPPAFVLQRSIVLRAGEHLDRKRLTEQLVHHGYLHVEQVTEPGEFAVRGALLDVYPTGAARPVRIDLFDDEIESLRLFDPHTQLTTEKIDAVRALPAREFPFDETSIRGFRQRFRSAFPGDPSRSTVYREISEARLPPGIEYYLPLFFDETASLLDYLPADTLLVLTDGALAGLQASWELTCERHEQLAGDPERPILSPQAAFWSPADLKPELETRPTLDLAIGELPRGDERRVHNAATAHPLAAAGAPQADRIDRWLAELGALRTLVVTSSTGRREMILELLQGRGYAPVKVESWQAFLGSPVQIGVAIGDLEEGLRLPDQGIQLVTAEQLGVERPTQRARRRRASRDPEALIRELTDLRAGAPVVHEEYGIGRYLGLKTLEVDGIMTEFLLLEYAGGDKLYVPVQNLHLVTRYTGASPEQVPLHRLGSEQWLKARQKAARQARDAAAELLDLYARRAARPGKALRVSDRAYQRFAGEFPFEETDDQIEAIREVLTDLGRDRPMDRVICGDVGFGKTEVALRSAFVAVHAGYQVAVLVPTTLLAQQHYRTFSDRFAEWPVRVEVLSRFRSAKTSNALLAGLRDGTVDVVVGTHKLLQPGIEFKRLGLLIIDEEHRFGVRHKERLKQLKADVHLLTMTATPIPRTLNMTLGGLRDLSIIATPPVDRLSVKTFVGEWSDRQIREAVLREIRRGGQVYFVHNRVEEIERIGARLRQIVPEAETRTAHGQMSERTLERVMLDFYHRRFNLLLCSTIIESGIDIPTANTIIINRADRLGLAQLHQLRGRVGRSNHQAYAYLIAPPRRALSADAAKRLEAIEALEELGAGFTLATHDLEIRGAGELLGEEQSGQIQAVGFTFYNELLARAVTELRSGREPQLQDPFHHGPEISLGLAALIPEDYMPDVHMRLIHYKRIANARSRGELDDLQVELIDRFGLLPPQTRALFGITWLKLLAQGLGVVKIQAGNDGGTIRFGERANVDPAVLVRLIEEQPELFRLDGPVKLRFTWPPGSKPDRLAALETLLLRLGADPASEAA
jgi:transcription-repair coupling factor (superfamily II helicase)